ncbi:MAG: hypothetical protein LBI43_04050 [Streptococcaceae bacterium]|jgi:hypothetical protein|nr:hypothetical protein [Streptococcaceae bacterium]
MDFDLGDLAEKAEGLAGNLPDDVKEKAGEALDALKVKTPDQVDGVIDDVALKLGL